MSPTHPLRRLARIAGIVGFVVIVVAWAIFLRPQFLGGPAGFVTVAGTSMEPRMHTGDVVLVHRQDAYAVGDVVAYRIPRGQAGAGRVVIHRIVGGSARDGYVMRGDNRGSDDMWRPRPADVVGKQKARAPAVGLVARTILTPVGLGLLAALAVFALSLGDPGPREPRRLPILPVGDSADR